MGNRNVLAVRDPVRRTMHGWKRYVSGETACARNVIAANSGPHTRMCFYLDRTPHCSNAEHP